MSSDKTDVVLLIAALESSAKTAQEHRPMLLRAAHSLREMSSFMTAASENLRVASLKRAGMLDSLSRHEEVTRQKNSAMDQVATDLMHLLLRKTPRYADTMLSKSTLEDKSFLTSNGELKDEAVKALADEEVI